MTIQNGLTPLIFRWVMTSAKAEDRFHPVEAVFMQETLKLVLSCLLLFQEEGGVWNRMLVTLERDIWSNAMDTFKLSVPAILYFIQNICLQLASSHLPAAVFQVLYQGKSLVVALCSVFLLSKIMTRVQWMSIGLMGTGLAIVQLARSVETKQSSMANRMEQSTIMGLMYTFIGVLCSGFAGVYFEKMMKQPVKPSTSLGGPMDITRKPSMWTRNIQLAGFSMLIGLMHMLMVRATLFSPSEGSSSSTGSS